MQALHRPQLSFDALLDTFLSANGHEVLVEVGFFEWFGNDQHGLDLLPAEFAEQNAADAQGLREPQQVVSMNRGSHSSAREADGALGQTRPRSRRDAPVSGRS